MKSAIAQVGTIVRIRSARPNYTYKVGEKYIITDQAGLSPKVIPTPESGYMVGAPVGGGNTVSIHICDMAPNEDADIVAMEKDRVAAKAALDLIEARIAYMKKHKVEDFDEYAFNLYRALEVLEGEGKTIDKAASLMRIFPKS